MEQVKFVGEDNSGSLTMEQASAALSKLIIKSVSPARIMEMAIKAGHKCDIEGSKNPKHITERQQLAYLKFFAAISAALQEVAYKIDHLDLEQIRNIAISEANYNPYDMFKDPTGIVNVEKMVASENEGLFYTRFAYQIAAELA